MWAVTTITLSLSLYYFFGTTFLVEAFVTESFLDETVVNSAEKPTEITDNSKKESFTETSDNPKKESSTETIDSPKKESPNLTPNSFVKWYYDISLGWWSLIFSLLLTGGLIFYFYEPYFTTVLPADIVVEPYKFNRIQVAMTQAQIEAALQNVPKGSYFSDVKALLLYDKSGYLNFPEWFFPKAVHEDLLVVASDDKVYALFYNENPTAFRFHSTSHLRWLLHIGTENTFGYTLQENQFLMFTKVALVDPSTLNYAFYQRIDVVTFVIEDDVRAFATITDSYFQKWLIARP